MKSSFESCVEAVFKNDIKEGFLKEIKELINNQAIELTESKQKIAQLEREINFIKNKI